MEDLDFYKLINVSRTASEKEIRKAFRKKALELHPDKETGDEEMMKRLTMVKDTLLDPEKRQKYDDDNDDMGTGQDISGFLNCGKRLSNRYKRKLAQYMARFNKIVISNNFIEVYNVLSELITQMTDIVNSSTGIQNKSSKPSAQPVDTSTLQHYFYEGKYKSMALFMIGNQCNRSSIEELHAKLTAGRDTSSTPPSFQAGLLLLQGKIYADDLQHNESLKMFQQAVLTCPIEEVTSAVNILTDKSHFIAATQDLMQQLLKGTIHTVQEHGYQDRLKRTNHLRLISKFEKGVMKDQEKSLWEKAMMYIDLTMATSGVALVHCFLVAMTYLFEDLLHNDNDVARVYAIVNIICELGINVVVLSRRIALPVTEMHFNKLCFIILRKSHDVLKSKLPEPKKGTLMQKMKTLLGKESTIETKLVTEMQVELYKMIANSICRLIKVSPFVDLSLTTAADMIYIDVVCDDFVEEFYKSRILRKPNSKEEDWTHLFQYYLLECAWKTGKEDKLLSYREDSMKVLLHKNSWSPSMVEQTMNWKMINRDDEGWLDMKRPWLNLEGINYDSVDGVDIDIENGTFRLSCTPSPPGKSGLINEFDIVEVIYNGLQYSIFSLDPPDNDLQYNPFHQLKFTPESLVRTNFLQTLLHADYLLKMMSMGTEVSANFPHPFRNALKKGFLQSLPLRLRDKLKPVFERRGGNKKENVHRFWIESGMLEYKQQEKNEGKILEFRFGPCPMNIKTHLMKHNSEGELVDDSEEESDSDDDDDSTENTKQSWNKKKRISAETQFANEFSDHYDQIGYYFPILLRLRELLKLVSIFGILKGIHSSLEEAKKGLKESLQNRINKAIRQMRSQIKYPQNNSSNVNKIYYEILRDQSINESRLAPGEEARAKSSIRSQLSEVDKQQVTEISKVLASSLEITNCRTFERNVENWLNDSIFTSYTKDLISYISDQVYPREFKKLDRFSQNAAANYINFSRNDDTKLGTTDSEECPWVPAAFSRDQNCRVYGGVCLAPQLRNVSNFSRWRGGGGSFARGTPASAPVGSRYFPLNQPNNPSYQPVRNLPESIGGRMYSGHALDRMQDRGIFLSVVNHTISRGSSVVQNGKTYHYCNINKLTVITNATGGVVSVGYGKYGIK